MVNYKTLNHRTFDSVTRRRFEFVLPAVIVKQKIPWRKFLSLSLAGVLLFGSNLTYLRPTMSYFTDTAQSRQNLLASGTLSFAVSSPFGFEPKKIRKGDPSVRLADVTKTGTLDFQYKIHSEITSQDASLCNALKLKAILDQEGDKDDLVGYTTDAILFAGPEDSWKFKLTLPKGFKTKNLSAKTCEFDLVFLAWQPNLANPTAGFTDSEVIHNIVRIKGKQDSDDHHDWDKDDKNYINSIDIDEDEDEEIVETSDHKKDNEDAKGDDGNHNDKKQNSEIVL